MILALTRGFRNYSRPKIEGDTANTVLIGLLVMEENNVIRTKDLFEDANTCTRTYSYLNILFKKIKMNQSVSTLSSIPPNKTIVCEVLNQSENNRAIQD